MSCESLNENFDIRIVQYEILHSPFLSVMLINYYKWRMMTDECTCTVLYEWDGVNVCTIKYQKIK
jgi:hypothetical protein